MSEVQYSHLTEKPASKFCVLCRLSKLLPFHLLNTVYLTIFQQKLDYCFCLKVWALAKVINQ